MSRPLKRARTSGVRVARPIDKELKAINHNDAGSTQRSTVLKTTTFPGTVVGLRWDFSAVSPLTTAAEFLYWVIVVVPDGEAVNTIGTSDGVDMYTPEQNVLAFGNIALADADIAAGPQAVHVEGSTKTMRKLKQGDVLQFSVLGLSGTAGLVRGVIQFFFKT